MLIGNAKSTLITKQLSMYGTNCWPVDLVATTYKSCDLWLACLHFTWKQRQSLIIKNMNIYVGVIVNATSFNVH